jgi:acyl carrier protein
VAKELAAQQAIEVADDRLETGVLRRQLAEASVEAVDPEDFWEIGEAHGYDVQVSWHAQDSQGRFDVQFLDRARLEQVPRAPWAAPAGILRSWSAYASDPLESAFRQQLIPQLREYLKARLPDYMIPSAWVALKELPLTPHGKVDRRALPAPQTRPEEIGEYVAPRTELERNLADIWAQVLRVDQVGVNDNFFELGGHSLLATRVIAHIGHLLDLELPLRVIFEKPTIEALSDSIVKQITSELSMEAS